MARVNIDILGISELKWKGTGEFNSDDHYTFYCGQESLRRNGVALIVCIIIYVYICVYMSAYVYIYMCVCVCVLGHFSHAFSVTL